MYPTHYALINISQRICDIIATFARYICTLDVALTHQTNMQNIKPTVHAKPLIIKPYTFPDTISNPTTIHAIDPELDPPHCCHILKSVFTMEDLEWLIQLVAEKEPWMKPHGGRTKAWESVLCEPVGLVSICFWKAFSNSTDKPQQGVAFYYFYSDQKVYPFTHCGHMCQSTNSAHLIHLTPPALAQLTFHQTSRNSGGGPAPGT